MSKLKRGKPRHGETLKINAGISLDPSVIEELDRVAQEMGIKRSQLVSEIIKDWLLSQEIR